MSKIDIEWYSQLAPVLNQPGWYETSANGLFGDCFFRNVVHQQIGLKITVGIVVCPSSWHYCANFITPGYSQGFKFGREKDNDIKWEELKELVKQKGLEAHKSYLDRREDSIWEDFKKAEFKECQTLVDLYNMLHTKNDKPKQ